jgi:hypothetical protein
MHRKLMFYLYSLKEGILQCAHPHSGTSHFCLNVRMHSAPQQAITLGSGTFNGPGLRPHRRQLHAEERTLETGLPRSAGKRGSCVNTM